MRSFLDFIKYNNAFPLILVAVLFVSGVVVAASPDLRQAVLSGNTHESIGNMSGSPAPDVSLLQSFDLDRFDFDFQINSVRQNAEIYFIDYSYRTLEIVQNTWGQVSKSKTLEIPKLLLGKRDLGLYAAEQINQVMEQEMRYLGEVQSKLALSEPASGGVKQYAGLVGKKITDDGVIDGYKPVVKQDPVTDSLSKDDDTASTLTVELPGASGTLRASLTKQEVRNIIVEAVADFLAIQADEVNTDPPVVMEIPPSTPEVSPEESSQEESSPVLEEELLETDSVDANLTQNP